MRRLPSRPSALITLTVALATLCALALPEGNGGRDSVVRLTRGGLQRLGCADTTAFDHGDPEAVSAPENEPQPESARFDGTPTPVVIASPAAVPVPTWHSVELSWPAPGPRLRVHPGHAVAGRAPPAL